MNSSASTVTGKIKIKIVFLGNQAVGKSSIIDRYVNDRFDETAHVLPSPPSPPSVSTSSPKTSSTRPRATVCSSGTLLGRNASEPIPGYLRDAQCALIIFDVASRSSLNNADAWLQLYNDNKTGQGFTLLVGNKVDL